MAQPASPVQETRPDRQTDGGWTRWLAAGTFVLGLVVGVLLIGLLGQDPPASTTAPGAAPTSGPAEGDTDAAGPTGIEVNEACLRALNAAQDIAATVDDLGAAAVTLDAAQLDEVIRRLQPLQQRLEENTAACEATGSLPTEDLRPTEGAQPTGTAEPAAPATPTG
jgi:hypothetical protein